MLRYKRSLGFRFEVEEGADLVWGLEKVSFPGGVCVLVTQSCQTPCDPMDCSPPGSSVHRILQARILEWVAVSFSRGSS